MNQDQDQQIFFQKELLEVNEAKSDGQKKAIKAIINEGNNVVVNIPTGMGKSLVIKVHAAIYRGWVLGSVSSSFFRS